MVKNSWCQRGCVGRISVHATSDGPTCMMVQELVSSNDKSVEQHNLWFLNLKIISALISITLPILSLYFIDPLPGLIDL